MTAETDVPVKEENHDGGHQRARARLMPLFTRPVQRQRWEDTQIRPVVQWGDLFFGA